MGIKKAIKKIPFFGTFIVFIYNKTVKRLKNDFFKNLRYYNINIKKKEISSLKLIGVTKIKKYSFDDWKFDSGLDHSYRRYYVGVFKGVKCFIKISKNDLTVFNEICVSEDLPAYSFVPKTLFTDKSFNGGFLLVQERLFHLINLEFKTEKHFDNVCVQFNNILDCFNTIALVHCDVHRGNLMIDKRSGRLFLLDFGISKFANKNNMVDYLARPGTFYQHFTKNNCLFRKYDDAYSFVKETERMNVPPSWKECLSYQKICTKVGRNTIDIVEEVLNDDKK